MRFGKGGAVNWTIGKLINIVLLTVVMALIIFGITTGGLNPLIENVEGKFNEVLIMFNLKDDVSFAACFSEDVANLGGGEVFLKEVGLEGENIRMNVCRGRVCNFTGELEGYRYNEGVFEMLDGGEWINDPIVGFGDTNSVEDLHWQLNKWSYVGLTRNEVESSPIVGFGDAESAKLNWQIYREVSSFLESAEGLEFLRNPIMTKKFVLTGDSGNGVRSIVATWQNNVWKIERNVNLPEPRGNLQFTVFTEDDALAIDVFTESASVSGKDDVTYNDGMGDSGEISKLVGDGWFSRARKLDSKEAEKLKSEFAKKKEIYLDLVRLSEEQISNLTGAVNGKSVFIDGVEFIMEARGYEDGFRIFVNLGDTQFLVKYMLRGEYDVLSGCVRNPLPIVLRRRDEGSIGGAYVREDESYYKLDEECFNNFYRKKLAYDFLGNKCR